MIRALIRLATFVSLLLFLAVVALWVRGLRTMDHFWLIHGDNGSELIRSAQGRLTVRHTRPNGRSRITLPRRVSHWSCAVGSQLPPGKSRLHWEWRFLNYEGTPAATAAEVRGAHAAIRDGEKVRAELNVTEGEWAAAQYRFGYHPTGSSPLPLRHIRITAARAASDRGQELLAGSSYWEWTFPAWLAAPATAIAPALWVAGWRRRRRMRREGRCPGCGYDLRASADRCPECGLSVGANLAPAAPT